ncbi:MAG: class II fructose-bisphosphate aldolase [Enterococcus avium]
MLVSMKALLDVAKVHKFAVAAPNVFSLETTEAAYQCARELEAPIILNVWDDGDKLWIEKQSEIVKFFDKKYPDVICALNLDHGQSYDREVAAIKSGFTSVMTDRSTLPFEENISAVKRIVDVAHAVNVSVEAELGHVGQGEEYATTRDQWLTKPEEAAEFVSKTGCDMLAVAIGTSHGAYKGTPIIDFDLLKVLSESLNVPLVLHGGSNTGDDNLRKCVEFGIQKINLCTDLQSAYIDGVKRQEKLEDNTFRKLYDAGPEAWKQELKHYIKLFKSTGKANLFNEYLSKPDEEYYGSDEEDFVLTT